MTTKNQKRLLRNHAGEVFEVISEGEQQSESSHGKNISTYPAVILKNSKTGLMTSVLKSRIDLCFSPHFTEINTKKDAEKFFAENIPKGLNHLLSKEVFLKMDQAASVLTEDHVKNGIRTFLRMMTLRRPLRMRFSMP